MEFKGTKGTWKVDGYDIYSDNDKNKELIEGNLICCAPEGYDLSMKNWKANAKLIALAPEMFEMLKRSIKEIEHLKAEYKDVGHCGKYLFECENLLNKITQ